MQDGDVCQYCYAVFWCDVHVQTVGHGFSLTSRRISVVLFTHLSFSDVLQYDTMLNKNKKYKLKEKSQQINIIRRQAIKIIKTEYEPNTNIPPHSNSLQYPTKQVPIFIHPTILIMLLRSAAVYHD